MNISWLGYNAFRLQHNGTTIITNPCETQMKFKINRQSADILLSSFSADSDTRESVSGNPFVIDSPGEYEIKSVFVYGVPAGEATMYLLTTDDLRLAFIGSTKLKELSDSQLEVLEGADVLIIPVGGGTVCSASEAAAIINQIEPRVVIPSYYRQGKGTLDPVDKFFKEYSAPTEEVEKFKVSRRDLLKEETKIVILKA